MSYHAPLNAEAEARYRVQRRNSTIASLIVGLLIVVLLGLILWAIAIPYFVKKTNPIVVYNTPVLDVEPVENKKIISNVVRKPTQSASSSAVKITAAVTSTSSFSIKTSETAVRSLNLDFGASDGFGNDWGDGVGFSDNSAGSFKFMGTKMHGERICFIIDYSQSMRGRRIELLKKELLRTVGTLSPGLQYELIFFAGPTWIAGSEVFDKASKYNPSVRYEGEYYDWRCLGGPHEWEHVGERQEFSWRTLAINTRRESLKAIEDTDLVWGTDWKSPLEMALAMKPQPGLIVFLTDGRSGDDSMDVVNDIGMRAKKSGIKINTIALMEPKARAEMSRLAELTGGSFALIDENGEKVNQK